VSQHLSILPDGSRAPPPLSSRNKPQKTNATKDKNADSGFVLVEHATLPPPAVLLAFCANFQQIVEARYGFDKENAQWKKKEGKMLSLLISRVVFRRTKSLWSSYFTPAMDVHAEVWSEHVWENTKNCALANFQVDKSFIPTSGGAGKGGGSARAGGDGDGAGVKGNAAGEEKSSVDSKEGEDEDDLFKGVEGVNLTPASVVRAEWAVYAPALDAFRSIFDAESPVGMGRSLLSFIQVLHRCAEQASGGKPPGGLDDLFPLIVACVARKWRGESAREGARRMHRGLAFLETFLVDSSGEVAFYLCSILASVSHLTKHYGGVPGGAGAGAAAVLKFSSQCQAQAIKTLRTFILHSDMQEDLSDTLLGF
jgi:hypothetical protein